VRVFYGVTCDRAEIAEGIAYARTPRTPPAIVNADAVVHFLEVAPSLTVRGALRLPSRDSFASSQSSKPCQLREHP